MHFSRNFKIFIVLQMFIFEKKNFIVLFHIYINLLLLVVCKFLQKNRTGFCLKSLEIRILIKTILSASY